MLIILALLNASMVKKLKLTPVITQQLLKFQKLLRINVFFYSILLTTKLVTHMYRFNPNNYSNYFLNTLYIFFKENPSNFNTFTAYNWLEVTQSSWISNSDFQSSSVCPQYALWY